MKKFYRQYKLLKDLPELPKGSVLKWNCWTETFTDVGDWIGLNEPKAKVKYTLDLIESKPDWFVGIGEQREYYPPFPDKRKFYSYEECGSHVADLEYGHNNMCRVCQLLNKLDVQDEVRTAVYEILKTKYQEVYLLTKDTNS